MELEYENFTPYMLVEPILSDCVKILKLKIWPKINGFDGSFCRRQNAWANQVSVHLNYGTRFIQALIVYKCLCQIETSVNDS